MEEGNAHRRKGAGTVMERKAYLREGLGWKSGCE
jgi:hypothetical protein